MVDPAAWLAAVESDDPFAIARLLHPGDVHVLVQDPHGCGYQAVLRMPRSEKSAAAELLDGATIILSRKAKAGADTAAEKTSPPRRDLSAPADAATEGDVKRP